MANTTYTCTGCVPIDKSILAAYAALVGLNATAQTAEGGRVTAEESRVDAEASRVSAEEGRVDAEALRVSAEEGRVAAEEAREASKNVLVDGYYDSDTGVFEPVSATSEEIRAAIEAGGVVTCHEMNSDAYEIIIAIDESDEIMSTKSWTVNYTGGHSGE